MLCHIPRRLYHLTCTLTLLLPAGVALAQSAADLNLVMQPHCVQEELNDDWMFGNIPDVSSMVTLGEGHCSDFEVESPNMLRTQPMSRGDTLDLDVVIKNPDTKKIQRARVWISYDSNLLEGMSIDIDDDFPQVTPGEEDFDPVEGFAMIDTSADTGDEPDNARVVVARVKFKVKETIPGGAILGFYDAQENGHTLVLTKDDSNVDGVSALSGDPGSLHVIFGMNDGETCQNNSDCLVGTCIQGKCTQSGKLPEGAQCSIDSQCESEFCIEDHCANEEPQLPPDDPATDPDDMTPPPLSPNGAPCTDNSECHSDFCHEGFCRSDGDIANRGSCTVDEECVSGTCLAGICIDPTNTTGEEDGPPEQTAFALLQVQNLGVTTKEDSAYLGWDPLQSSRLKAYNIYYGTTTGRYIQRKTVDGTMTNLVLHSLPTGTTYYFAVRAVSTDDEESAFSNEVSVTIGDPSSASSPLTADITGLEPAPPNPVEGNGEVPGETGVPSTVVFLLFASAAIGTVFASRRQLALSITKPK